VIKQALEKMLQIERKHFHPLDEDARMTNCGKGDENLGQCACVTVADAGYYSPELFRCLVFGGSCIVD
jgi:hypothetical protein